MKAGKLKAGRALALFLGALVPVAAAVPAVFAGNDAPPGVAQPAAQAQAPEVQGRWVDGRPARDIFRPDGERPRGAILLIHGGGWQGGDPKHMRAIAYDGRRLAEWGYLVWSVDYTSGRGSLPDLVSWLRLLRKRHPQLPVCAIGTSAGGNLALLLAVRRALRCAVSEAGPTDLTRFHYRTVGEFFPTLRDKRAFSPIRYVRRGAYRRDRILLAHLRDDPVVPFSQSRRFSRRAHVPLVGLPSGTQPFVHSRANSLALARYRVRQRHFLARSVALQRRHR